MKRPRKVHILRLSSILGGVEPAGDSVPMDRYPITSHESSEHWPLDCLCYCVYTVCTFEKSEYAIPFFLFSIVQLPQSQLVTWRIKTDDFNKMWLNGCLLLVSPHPLSLFSLLFCCSFLILAVLLLHFLLSVSAQLLFNADQMSPHSASAWMESK